MNISFSMENVNEIVHAYTNTGREPINLASGVNPGGVLCYEVLNSDDHWAGSSRAQKSDLRFCPTHIKQKIAFSRLDRAQVEDRHAALSLSCKSITQAHSFNFMA